MEREILNHRFLMHPQCVPRSALAACWLTGAPRCAARRPPRLRAQLLRRLKSARGRARARSIVQFKEVFLTPRYLAIAMEFVAGGDMFEYVVRKGGLKESEARWFFQQLIVGVDYLHRMVRAARSRGRGGARRSGRAAARPACTALLAERARLATRLRAVAGLHGVPQLCRSTAWRRGDGG